MLIHGGGNAWWNYLRQAHALSDRYHVILPTLDGHGEEYATTYVSTEDTADKLMAYIEHKCSGHLFALCGISLGGQIVMELLSRKPDLTQKAIIDGSLCFPKPGMAKLCIAVIRLFRGLMFSERFCRLQIAMMHRLLPEKMLYPEELKAYYISIKDSAKRLRAYIPTCKIYEAKGYNHGYLAIHLPKEWLAVAEPFFEQ